MASETETVTASEPITLQVLNALGRGLRLQFVWHKDRYAHTVSFLEGHRRVPLLASMEGSQDEAWPPSPPLPNLSVQPVGHALPTILLVGMAGTSHWSMSVEADENRAALRFDVACRAREQPPWIGSRYRTMTCACLVSSLPPDVCRVTKKPSSAQATVPPVEQSAAAAYLEIDGLGCRIETVPIGDLRATLQVTEGGLCVQSPLKREPPPHTWRWKYELRMFDRESFPTPCLSRHGSA